MKEIWKDIRGYEGKYQVSSLGRVKSLSYGARGAHYGTEKMLKPEVMKLGYLRVPFWDKTKASSNKLRRILIHRIVADAFGLIRREDISRDINHIDGNKANNSLNNLEICTRSENMKHAFNKGLITVRRGESVGTSKYTEKTILMIHQLKQKGVSRKDISERTGVPSGTLKKYFIWSIVETLASGHACGI
jgi:hypothetical protein